MTAEHNNVGRYIDKKADWARQRAKNGSEPDFYNHLATVLDALADEIRIGLHEMNVDNKSNGFKVTEPYTQAHGEF